MCKYISIALIFPLTLQMAAAELHTETQAKSLSNPPSAAAPVWRMEERVVHFPKDRSLGQLMIQDANTLRLIKSFHHWVTQEDTEWEFLGEAKGDVVIPPGQRLALSVSQTSWEDLSPLSRLQPDDLYMLSISGPYPSGPRLDDRCMPHVAHITGLKVLNLENTNFSARGMRYLGNLGSLERLYVSQQLTNDGLAEVARLSSLKGLYLKYLKEGHRLTNAGLAHFAKLTSLEELELHVETMNNATLANLAKFPSLKYLYLHSKSLTDAGTAYLKDVPSLRTLHLGLMTQLTNAALVHLSQIPNLERLNLHWNENITDAGVIHLKKLNSLKMLDISHSQVTDEGLAHLANIKSLEYLDLPHKGISDVGLSHLAKLNRLTHLDVDRAHYGDPSKDKGYYTDKGIRELSKLHSLEELSIGSIGVTDAGIANLSKLSNLRELSLFACPNLGNEGLEKLTVIKPLERLSISYTNVTFSGLSQLSTLPNLTYLFAHEIRRGDSALDVSGCTKLENLDLYLRSGDSFTDADLVCLAKLKSLELLQLYPNEFTAAGITYLAGLTELKSLSISSPDFNDNALRQLADLTKLSHLSISDGNITDNGLRYLENLQALRYLNITSRRRFSAAAIRRLRGKLPNLTIFQIQLKDNSTRGSNRRN